MLTDLDLAVLTQIVEQYDDNQQPVTPADLDDTLDADESAIRDCLGPLVASDLVVVVGDGYRPTITARELLALDIDFEESLVVLDFDTPEASPSVDTREERKNGHDLGDEEHGHDLGDEEHGHDLEDNGNS